MLEDALAWDRIRRPGTGPGGEPADAAAAAAISPTGGAAAAGGAAGAAANPPPPPPPEYAAYTHFNAVAKRLLGSERM